MHNSLFFNQLIIIVYESVFFIACSALIHFKRDQVEFLVVPTLTTASWVVSGIALYSCLVLVLLLVLLSLRITFIKPESLELPSIVAGYGFLFQEISTQSKLARAYSLIFVLRRLILSVLFLFMQG